MRINPTNRATQVFKPKAPSQVGARASNMAKKYMHAKSRRKELPKTIQARPKTIALAALHISESILLELESAELLSPKEIQGLLKDAASTLRNAGEQSNSRSCMHASHIIESLSEQFVRPKS